MAPRLEAPPLRWKATFSSFPPSPSLGEASGTLFLRPQARRLVLINGSGEVVGARYLLMGEFIKPGSWVELPRHRILVGERCPQHPPATSVVDKPDQNSCSTANLRKLDSNPGLGILRRVWQQFRSSVSPGPSDRAFFLVASFARCRLRLDCASVAMILHSCLGGIAQDFNCIHLRDRTFKFSVSSQKVGFFIANLRHFACDEFLVFFKLWGNGGPDFVREFRSWQKEEDDSWMTVARKKKRYHAAGTSDSPRPSCAIIRC